MIPIEAWPERLERAAAGRRWIRRVRVVRETASTQDAARSAGAVAGDLVAAWRQTAGRGRLGRRWFDTGEDGVACSFVIEKGEPERLLAASAVAVCVAIEKVIDMSARRAGAAPRPARQEETPASGGAGRSMATPAPGIKWPNDILSPDGGKLAGILVECADDLAIIGIGVNVSQRAFPALDDASHTGRPPCSLAMMGVAADRVEVIEALMVSLDEWLGRPIEQLIDAYRARDRLRGTVAAFDCAGRRVRGIVDDVDPIEGIRVRTGAGIEVLPAATSTLAVATHDIGPT